MYPQYHNHLALACTSSALYSYGTSASPKTQQPFCSPLHNHFLNFYEHRTLYGAGMNLANFQKMTIASGSEEAPARRRKGKISFLDLPAELRNHIYKMAIQNVSQKTAYKASGYLQSVVRHNHSGHRMSPEKSQRLRVPYLCLMHTCRAIRYEFRSLYFKELVVHLGSLSCFIFAFIEHPKMPMMIAFLKFQQLVGTIRIVATPCDALELLPLLQLKARPESCKLDIQSEKSHKSSAAVLGHILNNRNETWLRWINTGVVRETEFTIFGAGEKYTTFHVTLLRRKVGSDDVKKFLNRLDCDKWIGLRYPGLSVRFHSTWN